jgi:hypothetical protein
MSVQFFILKTTGAKIQSILKRTIHTLQYNEIEGAETDYFDLL